MEIVEKVLHAELAFLHKVNSKAALRFKQVSYAEEPARYFGQCLDFISGMSRSQIIVAEYDIGRLVEQGLWK